MVPCNMQSRKKLSKKQQKSNLIGGRRAALFRIGVLSHHPMRVDENSAIGSKGVLAERQSDSVGDLRPSLRPPLHVPAGQLSSTIPHSPYNRLQIVFLSLSPQRRRINLQYSRRFIQVLCYLQHLSYVIPLLLFKRLVSDQRRL